MSIASNRYGKESKKARKTSTKIPKEPMFESSKHTNHRQYMAQIQ